MCKLGSRAARRQRVGKPTDGSALRCQPPAPRVTDGDERWCSDFVNVLDEAPTVGLFPDRKTWARGTPRLEDLGAGPGARADPLQKVEDQWFKRVGHGEVLHGERPSV